MKSLTILAVISLINAATCKWLEFDDVGYSSNHQLDLSGGVNTDQYTYTAPSAVAVVKSSAQRWQNSNYYYLSNLFDTSLYYRTHDNTHHHSYWLGSCSSNNVETIKIKFREPQDLSHIIVSARTLLSDRYSWYAIDAYHDATDFDNNQVTEAVHITQMINTNTDYFGQVHVHSIKSKYELLVFYITKPSTYCALNEIKIFARDPTYAPTGCPTNLPTKTPTKYPSSKPTQIPTNTPTGYPTLIPTDLPTKMPTKHPSPDPTQIPTDTPTKNPSTLPSKTPTKYPSPNPTQIPTDIPTMIPSFKPSEIPTNSPTQIQTTIPNKQPSSNPTQIPTIAPTGQPTLLPTNSPTTVLTTVNSNQSPNPTKRTIETTTEYVSDIPTTKSTAEPTISSTFTDKDAPGSFEWVKKNVMAIVIGVIALLFMIICILVIIVCGLMKLFKTSNVNNKLEMVRTERSRLRTSHVEGFNGATALTG
eukprot:1116420_1